MAIWKEEEEHPFANFNFNSVSESKKEEHPFANFNFSSAGGSSALGYSFDRAMRAAGRGISDLLPRMDVNLPENIQQYADMAELAGTEGMKEYTPKYTGGIFDQKGPDIPGFIGEKLAENATASAITMFGLTLGQNLMMRGPGATKLIGAGITGAVAGFNYLMLLDEAVETHASAAGKQVSDLTSKEIGNASWTAIENAGLDFILPNIWARSLNRAGLPAKKSLKELAHNLKHTEKEKIGAMLYKGAKQTAKSAGVEGLTEAAQQANMYRTSVLGLEGLEMNELATDFVVGAAGGGVYGSPVAVSAATDVNRGRKADKMLLDFSDLQKKIKAGDKYTEDVKAYEKAFNKLLKEYESIVGPKGATEFGPLVGKKELTIDQIKQLDALKGKNKPFNLETVQGVVQPPKKDIDKNVADIIPTLYNIPDDPKGFLRKILGGISELALRRSADDLPSIRKDVSTGKEMAAFMDVASGLTDVSSSSGETQGVSKSFETLRHKYIGDFVNRFEKISNKWTRHIPLMGEMAGNVRPVINEYIAAKLEKDNPKSIHNLAKAEANVKRALSRRDKKELDKGIEEIAKIQEEIWSKLNEVLGKDGLTIGHQKGYLTRGIDFKAVKRNPEAFRISLIEDVGLSEEEASHVLNNVLNDVDPNVFTSDQIRAGLEQTTGLGPSSFERIRTGKWDNLSSEFRNKDTLNSIERYLFSAVTRLASAEAFGGDRANKYSSAIKTLKDRNVINDAQTEKLWGMYDAYHNVYKKPRTENQRALVQAMKGLSTVTAVSYLGLATISSWTEPMWIGQRVGWYNMLKASPRIAGYALKGIARSIYGGREGKDAMTSFGRDLLRVMGMAIQPAMAERIDKLMAGDRNIALNYFFRSPGAMFLTQYTNFVRVWTAAAGLKMIQDQYNRMDRLGKTSKALLLQELRENGMSFSDFKQMGNLANGNIEKSILDDAYLDTKFTNSKGNEISVRDVLIPWLRKITTDVALEPTAGNRPLWMSRPDMLLIAQLKSFPILFGNTIARRLNAKMNPQFCSADFVGKLGSISAISAAIGMAALAMAVKDAIKGVEEDRGALEIVSAIGIPLIGEIGDSKVTGYIAGPGPALVDSWLRKGLGEDAFGELSEEVFEIFLRAATGRVGSEMFLGDR